MAENGTINTNITDKENSTQIQARDDKADQHVDWFYQCLTFLRNFNWIFDFKVTKIFVRRPWENIPQEWRQCLLSLTLEELNRLPYGEIMDCPDTFSTFIQTALKMSVPRGINSISPADIPNALKLGMNPKKQHEVSLMAALLHQLLQEASVTSVVDVGAGLGYLGQVLQRVYGYRVISLESDDNRTHGAQKRNEVQGHANSDKPISVTFNLQDDPEVMIQFQDLITGIVRQNDPEFKNRSEGTEVNGQEVFPTEVKICMTGLHCCGDLTPAMLKYFTKLDCVTLLACVSCCYHRMSSCTDEGQTTVTRNCPLSQSCQDAMSKIRQTSQKWALGTPAFRLAAQETRARWKNQNQEDHDFHQHNVAYRGILELFCHEENLTLNKITRKVALKKNCDSFDDYIDAVFDRVNLITEKESENGNRVWKHKLEGIYQQNEEFFPYIEPLTALQVIVQPVLENLIYQDRKRFLEEQGFQSDILSVFDDSVSPRNLVLVAKKCGRTTVSDTGVT